MVKVLSLDQSTSNTGYCLMCDKNYVTSGVISNEDSPSSFDKLDCMLKKISDLIGKEKPDFVVFEDVQFQRNYNTYKILARLQGGLMKLLFDRDIGFTIVEPSTWKACCGIKGRHRQEQKENTQLYVKRIYGISASEDEADSIGIAVWANRNLK